MKTKISDIAKKANVSTMTVSRVLNNSGPVAPETKKLVKKIMKELDYQPNLIARSLSSNKSMTFGVLIPQTEQLFLDNYIAQILSGITDVAQKNDYRITLIPIKNNNDEDGLYLTYARSKLFDGLILLKAKMDDPHISGLADSNFPFVLVNYKKNNKNYNYVDSENIKGAELAVDYLYKKGHKKIAFVSGTLNESNARDRLTGYKNSLKKNNLKFINDFIINGEFDQNIAFERSLKLLELKNRPTAIFCSDDYMAIGVIEQIKNQGFSVPEDIAVIGFDNIEISKFTKPSLTTVAQPMYEIGKSSVEVLLKLISKRYKPPMRKMLSTELIIRESA